ncbi:MAG: alpha/beta hydrolase [Candidatus Thermoplasmatota archaeon]|nr:alpha/beta hydrolase [Candidatus Thermoplasmatota archaeon]
MERLAIATRYGDVSLLFRRGEKYLVTLHGMGGSGNNWMKIVSGLPEDWGLVLPDLLGHGRSDRPDIKYEVSQQCEAINDLIRELEISDFSLMGHSYGGWISMRYQELYGGNRKVILVASAGINPTVVEMNGMFEPFLDRVYKVSSFNDRDTIRKILLNNGRPEEKMTESRLSGVPGSYLLIWGDNDTMIPLEYGKRLQRYIPGSRLEIIRGAGHMPHVTNPGVVQELVSSFLLRE